MVSDLEYHSPLGKSDHSVLNFTFNCYLFQSGSKITKYAFDKGDYESFKAYLEKQDWQTEDVSTNKKWETLEIQFKKVLINSYLRSISILKGVRRNTQGH